MHDLLWYWDSRTCMARIIDTTENMSTVEVPTVFDAERRQQQLRYLKLFTDEHQGLGTCEVCIDAGSCQMAYTGYDLWHCG